MLLLFAAVGFFVEAIAMAFMAPLIPFLQMGTIGNMILGEIEDVFEKGK